MTDIYKVLLLQAGSFKYKKGLRIVCNPLSIVALCKKEGE